MSGTVTHKDTAPQIAGPGWLKEHVFSGGSDHNVLVRDSGQSDGASWTASPQLSGLGLGIAPFANAGLSVKVATGPQLILQSGDTGEGNGTSPLIIRRGLNGDVMTMITPFGTYYTNTAIFINGGVAQLGTIDASGNFTGTPGYSTGTGLNGMLDIWADVAGPCIGARVSSVPGYNYQALDWGGNFVFSIENDGFLRWGASASGFTGTTSHAAMDCGLGRDAADVLALKRGDNIQKLRVYGAATGAHYLQFGNDGVNSQIGFGNCGNLTLGKLLNWDIEATGELLCVTHNTYDIGSATKAPKNVFAGSAFVGRTKAGAFVDGDVSNPVDGMFAGVDTTNNRVYFRCNGSWKFAALT